MNQQAIQSTQLPARPLLLTDQNARRFLRLRLLEQILRFPRSASPASLLLVKLEVAEQWSPGPLLASLLRDSDLVARWEENTFCVLLADVGRHVVLTVIQRLLERLARLQIEAEDCIRIGWACIQETDRSAESMIERAHESLSRSIESHCPIADTIDTSDELFPVHAEREEELEYIATGFRAALSGEPSLTVLQSPPSMGASSFLETHAHRLRHLMGCRVIQATCTQSSEIYQPFQEALARYLLPRQELVSELERSLRASERQILGTLLPAFANNPETPPRTAPVSMPDVGAALVRLFQLLSTRQPLLAIFEEMHLASSNTWKCLLFIVRNLDMAPMQLVLSIDSEAVLAPEIQAHFDELLSRPRVSRLMLEPFSLDRTRHVLERQFGLLPAFLVERIQNVTGGVPLLLEEALLKLGEAELPDEVRFNRLPPRLHPFLQPALNDLPGDTRRLLLLGAVLGEVVNESYLQRLSQWPEERVRQAIAPLLDEGIWVNPSSSIAAAGATYRFSNGFTRLLVLQNATYAELQKYHRLAAEFRIQVEESSSEETSRFLYEHFLAAGNHRFKAAHYARQAGLLAARRYSCREAAHYLRAAIDLAEDPSQPTWNPPLDLLVEVVAAKIFLGRLDDAGQILKPALESLQAGSTYVDLRILAIKRYLLQGQFDTALQDLERTKELVAERSLQMGQLLGLQAQCHASRGRYTTAMVLASRSLDRLQGFTPACFEPMNCLASVSLWLGRYSQAKAQYQELVRQGRQFRHRPTELLARTYLGLVYLRLRQIDLAQEQLSETLEEAQALGLVESEGLCLVHLGEMYRLTRHLSLLPQLGKRLALLLPRLSHSTAIAAEHQLSRIARASNHLKAAYTYARKALIRAEKANDRRSLGLSQLVLAETGYAAPGHREEGRELVRESIRILGATDAYAQAQAQLLLCEMLLDEGAQSEAASLLSQTREAYEGVGLLLPPESVKRLEERFSFKAP